MQLKIGGLVLATAIMVLSVDGPCLAQEIGVRAGERNQMRGMPQGYSQTMLKQDWPTPPTQSEEERQRARERRQKEWERQRIERLMHTVETEGVGKKRELRVVPRGRRFSAGQVSRTTSEGFTLVDVETKQESYFAYSEVEALYVVRSRRENAGRVAEGIGLGVLVIVTLPLTIFGQIIGWDGC